MGRISLKERIKQGVFLLDGAMGTELIARRIEPGRCNEYLNIESPDVVISVHRAYLEAGSDAVLTNTFGANKYALSRHGLGDKVAGTNRAGAEIAREAAGEERYVLGDIGPSGDFLEPLGMLKADELKAAFVEQAEALLEGQVDGFIIETMAALDEIAIAIEAVKSVCDLPVFASMAFEAKGGNFRTMMGVDVGSAVSTIVPLGVDAVGFNCGAASLDEYVTVADRFVSVVEDLGVEVAILAEPNAGRPELVDDRPVYKVSPEEFAATAEKIYSAGVNIIGGCCGTGPEHIKAAAKRGK
jgi:5-methyltetrahydrofolate--homocysteine methyltransferase